MWPLWGSGGICPPPIKFWKFWYRILRACEGSYFCIEKVIYFFTGYILNLLKKKGTDIRKKSETQQQIFRHLWVTIKSSSKWQSTHILPWALNGLYKTMQTLKKTTPIWFFILIDYQYSENLELRCKYLLVFNWQFLKESKFY